MVGGGDNYFMCAGFSSVRMEKTQRDFCSELLAKRVGSEIQKKIQFYHGTLREITDHLRTANDVIKSIAVDLYWLDTGVSRL